MILITITRTSAHLLKSIQSLWPGSCLNSVARSSAKEFIETALFATGSDALSYSDSKQKWLILRHLLFLLQEYPSFKPSTGTFMNNDGTEINLLYASGCIHVSRSAPPIPLIIWLHENYPQKAPLVFVSADPLTPIHRHHPFVDTSGLTSSPYILNWKYPPCNLSDLLRNLVQLFSYDHPFSYSPSPPTSSFSHPSLVSRKEALDRLVAMLYYDMVALQSSTSKEIEELSLLKEELTRRDLFITSMISEMKQERRKLRESANNWAEGADQLENWLKVNEQRSRMTLDAAEVEIKGVFEIDEKSKVKLDCLAADLAIEDVLHKLDEVLELEAVFEIDEKSKVKLDCLAADLAIEDVLHKLDEVLELEAVTPDVYIKQVRSLATEQFFHRALEQLG